MTINYKIINVTSIFKKSIKLQIKLLTIWMPFSTQRFYWGCGCWNRQLFNKKYLRELKASL